MPSETIDVKARIKSVNAVLVGKKDQQSVDAALTSAKGDWTKAAKNLKGKLSAESLRKVTVAHSLASWADDHVPVVKALADQKDITNLRDVALQFNTAKLTAMIDAQALPADIAGATAKEKKEKFCGRLATQALCSRADSGVATHGAGSGAAHCGQDHARWHWHIPGQSARF